MILGDHGGHARAAPLAEPLELGEVAELVNLRHRHLVVVALGDALVGARADELREGRLLNPLVVPGTEQPDGRAVLGEAALLLHEAANGAVDFHRAERVALGAVCGARLVIVPHIHRVVLAVYQVVDLGIVGVFLAADNPQIEVHVARVVGHQQVDDDHVAPPLLGVERVQVAGQLGHARQLLLLALVDGVLVLVNLELESHPRVHQLVHAGVVVSPHLNRHVDVLNPAVRVVGD